MIKIMEIDLNKMQTVHVSITLPLSASHFFLSVFFFLGWYVKVYPSSKGTAGSESRGAPDPPRGSAKVLAWSASHLATAEVGEDFSETGGLM